MVVPDNHLRFSQAPWYGIAKNCFIGGVGSIGSWLALFLARAGHNLSLCDFDSVDVFNLAGQLYGKQHIGMSKVHAIKEVLLQFCATTESKNYVRMYNTRVENVTLDTNFVFSCFDSVSARRYLFEKWVKYCNENPSKQKNAIFIDGRLTAESYILYSCRFSHTDISRYMATLYDESEVQPEVCSYKATTHVAASLASDMLKVFNNHLSNIKLRRRIRSVPISIFHESIFMSYDTIE